MDTPSMASGVHFAICPLCEASRLVLSGLYSARCTECGIEPSEGSLKTLRRVVTLPDTAETPQSRHERGTSDYPGEQRDKPGEESP